MVRSSLYMLACSVLATSALAQESLRSKLRPITAPIKDAGTLHLGTGTWTRSHGASIELGTPSYVYVNTCSSGYHAGMIPGEIFTDEGGIPNPQQTSTPSTAVPGGYDTNPGCADTYNITGFQISYCTFQQVPYSADVSFYDMVGPAGKHCPPTGVPTATFHLTGLPGTGLSPQACWLVTIDLTATTPASNFTLTGTGVAQNKIFAWSYTQPGPSSLATPDGPVIAGGIGTPSPAPCTGTDGTRWDNGTASIAFPNNKGEEGTGMFNLDGFRLFPGGDAPGCYWFGGNPRGSFYLELYSDVTCATTPPGVSYCFGDGTTATACPCGNFGAPGAGCNNSVGNGGANLVSTGSPSLANDTLTFTQTNELATSLSIFLHGTTNIPTGIVFGDGVRCVGGSLKRLYVRSASGGTVSAPTVGVDPPVSAVSAILGDTIIAGSSRFYGVYYRDADATFCPDPPGNTWNIGNSYQVTWQP